ncbi:MAG: DUF2061 domain-containing protein [Candidatus Bathyarchaeota archaeon]|nr:MAG: DUF2061 domain-containing protein [Candidatus Bathyarchaeota archaeon]
MMENRTRSIFKSVSFRLIATLTTVILVFVFTGEIVTSLKVGSIEFLAKIALYYFHERVWDKSHFGRK